MKEENTATIQFCRRNNFQCTGIMSVFPFSAEDTRLNQSTLPPKKVIPYSYSLPKNKGFVDHGEIILQVNGGAMKLIFWISPPKQVSFCCHLLYIGVPYSMYMCMKKLLIVQYDLTG